MAFYSTLLVKKSNFSVSLDFSRAMDPMLTVKMLQYRHIGILKADKTLYIFKDPPCKNHCILKKNILEVTKDDSPTEIEYLS